MASLPPALKTILAPFAKFYKKILASRLGAYGLKYDDLLIETDDMKKALNRVPREDQISRFMKVVN